jgi:hypothetical protein
VGGDEPDLAHIDLETLRGHAIRLGRRLQTLYGIRGESLLEAVAQPGVLQLRFRDLLRVISPEWQA